MLENSLVDLVDKSLDFLVKKGVDDAIVSVNSTINNQLRFTKDEIFVSKRWQSSRLSVYLAKDKKIAATDLDDISSFESISNALEDLLVFTNALQENKDYHGIATDQFSYQDIPEIFDSKITDMVDNAVDHVESSINAAHEAGGKYSAGAFDWGITESYTKTNHGIKVEDKGTRYQFLIRSFLSPFETGQGISVGRILKFFDPIQAGTNAGELASQARNVQLGKGGTYNALFAPTVVGDIIASTVSQANPSFIEMGRSWLQNKIGEKVASDHFSAYDDGRYPNGISSAIADDEGVPRQRTPIIEQGILKNLIYNTNSARKAGTNSTGNAGLIFPQNSNIIIESGSSNFDEMIAECKSPTIYVTCNWYTTTTSAIEGIFSTIPRDAMFLIENGEIQQSIRELRISDSFPNLMANIIAIQNKIRQIKWWVEVTTPVFAPAILIENVRFTTGTK